MASYTTQVRTILMNAWMADHPGETFPGNDVIINEIAPKVIQIAFPPDSGLSSDSFAKAILRWYYMREIGLETVGLWAFEMNTRLNVLAPKYVSLAKAWDSMGKLFETDTFERTWQDNRENNMTGGSSGNGTSKTTASGTENNSETRDGTKVDNGTQATTGTGNTVTDETRTNAGTSNNTITKTGKADSTLTHTGKSDSTVTHSGKADNTETHSGTNSQTTTGEESTTNEQNTTTNAQDLISDTPQNGLSDVLTGKYLTRAQVSNQTVGVKGSTSGNTSQTISGETNETITNAGTTSGTDSTVSNDSATDTTVSNTSGTDTSNGSVNGTDTLKGTSDLTTTENVTSENNTVTKDTLNSERTTSNMVDGTTANEMTKHEDNFNQGSGRESRNGYHGDKANTFWNYKDKYFNVYQEAIKDVADLFLAII